MTKILQKVLFLLLLPLTINSQQELIRYSTTNGLPHDVCYAVFQDSNEFIWIATDDGLTKFDGTDFKTYTTNDGLSSNYIIDIKELSNGFLALATWRGGLNIFNPHTESFISDPEGPTKLSNLEIYRDTIYNLHNDLNNIYAIDSDLKIKHDINRYKSDINAYKFKVVNDTLYRLGSVLLKQEVQGIQFKKDHEFKTIFPFLSDSLLTAFNSLRNGKYIASTSKDILLFTFAGITKTIKPKLDHQKIDELLVRGDNHIIIKTVDEKGFKYAYDLDLRTEKITDLRTKYGIASTISGIFLDHENNIWLATYGEGVINIKSKLIDVQSITLGNNPINIEFLKNEVYILTNDSVFIRNDSQFTRKYGLSGYGKYITNIEDSIYITSLTYKKINHIEPLLVEYYGYRYYKTKYHGKILISDSIRFLSTHNAYPYFRNLYNIFNAFEFKKKLYFNSNIGLFVYDSTGIVKEKTINNKIGSSNLRGVAIIKDTLFLGSQDGLFKIYDAHVIKYTESEGLISNNINDLFIDHKNQIWIATQKGISIYNDGRFTNLNQETGLTSSFALAVKEDNRQNIWIAGNRAVNIIDNSKSIPKSKSPILKIEQEGSIFIYNGISYNRKTIFVEYKLNENSWESLSDKKGKLDFSQYKPGSYTVIFRAKKLDSDWSSYQEFAFKNRLPWYKNWWVMALIIFITASLIISLIWYQLKLSKRKNFALKQAIQNKEALEMELVAVRDNIAKDFHDDLGNKLARISIFSNLLNDEHSNLNKEDQELLKQIEMDANYLYKGTKDFIFSLKQESNQLEELITYISDFGEDYCRQFHIIFEVEKDISMPITLPYYWSKQIIFIIKEAMTNAVKHSKCSSIKLSVIYREDLLNISFIDNGKGFDKQQLAHCNGLKNMTSRAKDINCSISIKSESMHGTEITIQGKPHA